MTQNHFTYLRAPVSFLCLLTLCVIAPFAQVQAAGVKNEITFTSWIGPYMRSQMLGFVRPYEKKIGARVNVVSYNGGIGEIRDQVESANVTWDVVDLTQADSLRACEEGLLERIDDIRLPTGLSVKGWLGNGSDHRYKELETVIEDGYPTLKVVRLNGEGDHILIALEFGLYLPINNITCCFVSAVLPPLLMFLLITIKIIKKARKKKKERKGEEKGDGKEEGDDVEDTNRPEDPWDVPVDGNSPT
jgi:hypothetical protein